MNLNNQTKILWFGDLVVNTGFGRIGNEVTKRLHLRDWKAMVGASVLWSGYPPSPLPYFVWGLSGVDIWNRVMQLAVENPPDVLVVCQDFPYSQTLFHGTRLDWSKIKLIIITPIDGTPIHFDWLKMVDLSEATMVISEFGVEETRKEGRRVDLLHPGVNTGEFYPAEPPEKAALRAKLNIPDDAFVLGSFMMNQGRKCVPETLELFHNFALDKPAARLLMDMDRGSPAGWDIPTLCRQIDPAGRVLRPDETVLFRDKAQQAGLIDLRDRMALCDVSAQLAHREGFGLPNLETQACKVPPMVLDWCSGTEIASEGRGLLVNRLPYMSRGTWGGARDAFPDMQHARTLLERVYDNRDELARIASAGYEWAITHTWDVAADQFETVLKRVVSDQRKEREAHEPVPTVAIPAPGLSDERGPAHPEHPGSSVQQPGRVDALPGVAVSDGPPGKNGDSRAGRLLDGVQPDAPAAAAGSNPGAQ
jgi:hypothetical protein